MTDPNYPKVETIDAIDADEGQGRKHILNKWLNKY